MCIRDRSDLCLGVEKKIFKEIMHFYYILTGSSVSYTHLRAHETSLHLVCRLLLEKIHYSWSDVGVMKFTILVDTSLVIIIIYLVCLIYAWE